MSKERGGLSPWSLGQGPHPGSKELFSLHATSSGHLTSPPAPAAVRARLPDAQQEHRFPQEDSSHSFTPACQVCGSSSLMVAPVSGLGVYLEVFPHSSTASSSPTAQSEPLGRDYLGGGV